MEKKEFGLIGKTLKHSYSKIIHQKFNKYDYELIELAPEKLKDFAEKNNLKGYNVTIPYKKDIMPYLDEISKEAKAIGAVNTVVRKGDKWYGYNTDFQGIIYMLNRANISIKDKEVMILGTGGTSNTAIAVCKHLGAKEIIVVSRTGETNYENCYQKKGVQIIINTTPVGMFPNTNSSPIDLTRYSSLEGVVDVIYNPAKTKLLYQAEALKLKTTNGLPMLVAQAKYAMEYFLDQRFEDELIEKVIKEMQAEMQNLVLIGMPSSGKTTIGKMVAENLGREFIDIDLLIEREENRTIPEIFSQKGEGYFRKVEKEITLKTCSLSGKVISTGGGVVKDLENLFSLKQNGKVILIERDLDRLLCDGRPLSKDKETIKRLYKERKDLYDAFKDAKVENDGEIIEAVKGVITAYENLSN